MFKPDIPRIWDDQEIAELEVPLANPKYAPRHVSAEYYYRVPVRPIYRSYPVYAPGRAPAGYDSLRQKEPEIAIDTSRLRTPQEWSRAGETGFDAATSYDDPVFAREGCATCHTPPLYTANKLIPVRGFQVPAGHRKKYDILEVDIGVDPTLAMETRRGTDYYKIPSLRDVWCRGPLEHNGSVASLEDWFDPARLREDYLPTGFIGYRLKTRAVKGHEFGLRLPAADKKALIAFLKTL